MAEVLEKEVVEKKPVAKPKKPKKEPRTPSAEPESPKKECTADDILKMVDGC